MQVRRAWTWFATAALGLCVGNVINDTGGLRWFWAVGALSIAVDLFRDHGERRDARALDEALRRMGRIR